MMRAVGDRPCETLTLENVVSEFEQVHHIHQRALHACPGSVLSVGNFESSGANLRPGDAPHGLEPLVVVLTMI